MADIWNPKNLPDSRHLWLPITFDSEGVPQLKYAPLSSEAGESSLIELGNGYSGTSVNTAVFRTNSIVTNGDTQYISYYDPDGYVTLGKRKHGSNDWEIHKTQYKGNVKDGHNVISMGVDGDGYIHVSFDHHGHPLRYAKGIAPGSLELGDMISMTGIDEEKVTYPEFYSMSNGDLLFVYRSGASGRGNMAINRYDVKDKKWMRVQDSLLDGEEQRSPYWQLYIDKNDVIHVSWVWRETWLVETNHDLCYAKSTDGGKTWQKSDGTKYTLPITASNCEYACLIPQNSELINQTSMTADSNSHPYIVSYWRSQDSEIPQYRLVWHDGKNWNERQISERNTPFSLSGGGTKMIPISRPRIVAEGDNIGVIYRDMERNGVVTLTSTTEGADGNWTTTDLTAFGVGAWEPSLDTNLWQDRQKLHIFVQKTSQGDGEVALDTPPTPVYV
ncbi:MAG: BNR-4 repeat-containing protein, partial [Muribaculaceae bacterium]|nr:BNR-4 repeat-containing protein [Muribaculaceae bacterium]